MIPVYAANWVDIPNQKELNVYLDDSSIQYRDNNIALYWIKFTTTDKTENKMFMMSNCAENQAGIISTIKTFPNGKTIKDEKNDSDFKISPIVPDSISESTHNYVCKVISDNTRKWSILMSNKQKAIVNQDFYNAEIFLRQAYEEGDLLSQKGFGKIYFVKTGLELAKFYLNMNRSNDSLQLYQHLQFFIQDDQNYNDLNIQITNQIQQLKYKINDEISRQQAPTESQQYHEYPKSVQVRNTIENTGSTMDSTRNSINSGLNLIRSLTGR